MAKICGVLAMQGGYAKHCEALARCGAQSLEVRTLQDLQRCERLIIPGGESTTIYRLLNKQGLWQPLRERSQAGMPMLGTCAGMILLSRHIVAGVEGSTEQVPQYSSQPTLAAIDLTVERNAYGRQVASFCTDLNLADLAEQAIENPLFQRFLQQKQGQATLPLVFIRAPIAVSWGPAVQVLLRCPPDPPRETSQAICFQQGNILACSFHPELEQNTLLHEYFLGL